ncbi:MAG: hypothetical protein ABIB61_01945 [Candidatus Shapirobacteria bacterium]
MRFSKKIILFLILASVLFSWPFGIQGEDSDEKTTLLENQIQEYTQKLNELGKQKSTLSNEIAIMDSQIQLTALKIQQTQGSINLLEKQIGELGEKISELNISLDNLSLVFLQRVSESYKFQSTSPFSLFLSSSSFADFYRKLQYLKALQLNDRVVMVQLEETRSSFDQQKSQREEKQAELVNLKTTLDSQKNSLESQKSQKDYLLQITKNDEKRYQQLLSSARAEYEAIQAVLAGAGNEIEVGNVSKGEQIASIISGNSCNSSGAHLHFSVTQGNNIVNPFNYLSSSVEWRNCSGYSCGGEGDSFNPAGSWDWPINSPITFTQGYGNTWAVNHQSWLPYDFHNGIDIFNDSLAVKAVADGKLYRGSYTGIGGCALRYVRLIHKDSDVESYYLHINYTKF